MRASVSEASERSVYVKNAAPDDIDEQTNGLTNTDVTDSATPVYLHTKNIFIITVTA